MATSKKDIDTDAAGLGVHSVTTATPAEADKTSVPNALDGKANDPPVRTNRPDVPIAQVLAAGAGAHLPPDDPHIGRDGRYYANLEDAEASWAGWGGDPRTAANASAAAAARADAK